MIENATKSVSTVSYNARELIKEIRSSLKEKSFLKSFQMSISFLLSCKNKKNLYRYNGLAKFGQLIRCCYVKHFSARESHMLKAKNFGGIYYNIFSNNTSSIFFHRISEVFKEILET